MSLIKIFSFAVSGVLILSLFGCASSDVEGTTPEEKQQEVETEEQRDEGNAESETSNSPNRTDVEEASDEVTQEQEAKQVTESPLIFDYDQFNEAYDENKARAVKDYEGKMVQVTGWVDKIDEDYCIIGTDQSGAGGNHFVAYCPIVAYLSVDDLSSLNKGDKVIVQGTFEYEILSNFDGIRGGTLISNEGQTA